VRHGMTTRGLFRQRQAHSPGFPTDEMSREPERTLNSLAGTVLFRLGEHHLLVRRCGHKIGMTGRFMRFGVRPDTEVERLGGGRHTPAIELVSRSREPERSIS
jgi:hypothetical protein